VAFWRAVSAVGWLDVDETAATVAIPGWDRRFSQAAKARLQKADRAAAYEDRNPDRRRRAGRSGAQAPEEAAPTRRRGEERREEIPPPPHACARTEPDPARWAILRDRWNNGPGRPWTPPDPPDEAVERLAEGGWLDAALVAIDRLRACQFFKTPVSLPQFCGEKFVRNVNFGRYDELTDRRGAQRPADTDRQSAEAAAAEWKRSAADPERIRQRREFEEAKARKAARRAELDEQARRERPPAEPDPAAEEIRARLLEQLKGGAA
jgi:hypothetical protein